MQNPPQIKQEHNSRWLKVGTFLLASFGPASPLAMTGPASPLAMAAPASPSLANRSFQGNSPADFISMNLSIQFTPAEKKGVGKANIRFQTVEEGFPLFLMTPEATSATLDGQPVELGKVQDPEGNTRFTRIERSLPAGSEHQLQIEYSMPSDAVTYSSAGEIAFVTSMADITDGNFFEAYGPSNIEADQFKLSLELSIDGATAQHQLFTNGASTSLDPSGKGAHWKIEFPEGYTSSSFFAHLSATPFTVHRIEHKGLERTIPITIYSKDKDSADLAASRIKGLMSELEADYGPYLHPSFTAYIGRSSGGMEHAGATITSNSALGHELLHSWFGRGVFPSDGRSGWIDEAIASWRDNGYQRSSSQLERSPTNLANFSRFEIFTPYNVYADGRALMAELDSLFAKEFGGLKQVLRNYFAGKKGQLVTTEEFKSLIESQTGKDLSPWFKRYVFNDADRATNARKAVNADQQPDWGLHPTPLTHEEVIELR